MSFITVCRTRGRFPVPLSKTLRVSLSNRETAPHSMNTDVFNGTSACKYNVQETAGVRGRSPCKGRQSVRAEPATPFFARSMRQGRVLQGANEGVYDCTRPNERRRQGAPLPITRAKKKKAGVELAATRRTVSSKESPMQILFREEPAFW